MSEEVKQKVNEILKKSQLPDRHSFFQIEKFMIGKEPTGQAQLWAIVRELEARSETIECFEKDLADTEDNLELFDIKIEKLDREIGCLKKCTEEEAILNIKEREINIRKLLREKESLVKAARKVQRKLKYTLEEMNFLAEGFSMIVEKIGEMKPFDDEQSQKEMWNEKFLEDFNLRAILHRGLDPEFVRTVMCLHDEAPVKKHMISMIENIQKKMIADRKTQTKVPHVEVRPNAVGN
jgi:hypothetical protein